LEETRKISEDDVIQITIRKGSFNIRTLDNINFPIDVWNFDKKNLTRNEEVWINNIISMAISMAGEQDKAKNGNG